MLLLFLAHNDYATEFTEQLRRFNIALKHDFNPCGGKVFKDPKLSCLLKNIKKMRKLRDLTKYA